ncbi:putative concanavalin a-like lectins glucanase [Erysiphe neolycopersici]|uniref:Putative concanavalin a-like lectins glucanase n=1 Tax=Erysiphe neolycopersici TaxID=212602 RepID=A0A420I2X6_9PEZI|nr:putative concanavalin a-like lectins glucanase [Erysiphe neolycopersici]
MRFYYTVENPAKTMGMSRSRTRWVAPISFISNFSAQLYGILSSPNMKEIHDANLSFWSPQPYLIAAIFFPQQLLQLVWLYRLLKLDPKKNFEQEKEIEPLMEYLPYYCIGNFCIAIWMIFWNQSDLKIANIFVLVNGFIQLYYVFGRLSPMDRSSPSSILTHLVTKTFAGIGFIDILHNSSVAYFDHQGPDTAVKIVTGVGFSALATRSDWIFGGCLVYDLIALSVGQRGIGEAKWGDLLAFYALGTALIVVIRNIMRPNQKPIEYIRIDGSTQGS